MYMYMCMYIWAWLIILAIKIITDGFGPLDHFWYSDVWWCMQPSNLLARVHSFQHLAVAQHLQELLNHLKRCWNVTVIIRPFSRNSFGWLMRINPTTLFKIKLQHLGPVATLHPGTIHQLKYQNSSHREHECFPRSQVFVQDWGTKICQNDPKWQVC